MSSAKRRVCRVLYRRHDGELEVGADRRLVDKAAPNLDERLAEIVPAEVVPKTFEIGLPVLRATVADDIG